jgi:hypothetical protein
MLGFANFPNELRVAKPLESWSFWFFVQILGSLSKIRRDVTIRQLKAADRSAAGSGLRPTETEAGTSPAVDTLIGD